MYANNTFNYGSAMMAYNCISYLNDNISNMKFYIDINELQDLKRLKLGTKVESIYGYKNKYYKEKIFILSHIKNIIMHIKKIHSIKPNIIIILGGDAISSYYNTIDILMDLIKIYFSSIFIKTYLLSQSIGPFHSLKKIFVRLCLNNTLIFNRELITSHHLKYDLNIISYNSSDLAFLDLPMQNKNKNNILNKYNIKTNEYATIIPSGLINKYTKYHNRYIKNWKNIIERIIDSKKLKTKKIVLLAHVLKPNGVSDTEIINKIIKIIPKKYSTKIICITDPILPSEARHILSNSNFTITGRMHGAISTFQSYKPAISLSYSIKYKGVIGKNLKMDDLIIESNIDNLWKSNKIVELVIKKAEYIIDNYDEIIKRIKINVEINKKRAKYQLKYVVKNIDG